MERASDTYLEDARREHARSLVEKLLREVRQVEQDYPAANFGLGAVCQLALERISGGATGEGALTVLSTSRTQGAAAMLANLESRWRLGLVPLAEYRVERRRLGRRRRLARLEENPALGCAVRAGAHFLEWLDSRLLVIAAFKEQVPLPRVRIAGRTDPSGPVPLRQLNPRRPERSP